MKQKFREDLHLSKSNKQRLYTINRIIEEYRLAGYILTLRQLYYQLVSRDIIPNQQNEYSKLSTLLVKGRMAGEVDWSAIEDRIRTPFLPYWVTGIEDALEDTIDQYRLDRQENQKVYIELWVEKDALSGVLKSMTSYYHINLMVNRGYSSCSAMYDAQRRFIYQAMKGKIIHILYLGDHDPSGLDMIRDVKDRLSEFGVTPVVNHVALTMNQIEIYNPPPNPAKISDPRAGWYINEFGGTSWEVDALNPETLNNLIKENIEGLIDIDKFKSIIAQEEQDKNKLRNIR
jgi:hypothetical protein